MAERQQLIAYLATLATLVIVFMAALIAACISPGIIGRLEAFGLGTITGGLIGVLRMPVAARTAVGQADMVNTGTPAPPPSPSAQTVSAV